MGTGTKAKYSAMMNAITEPDRSGNFDFSIRCSRHSPPRLVNEINALRNALQIVESGVFNKSTYIPGESCVRSRHASRILERTTRARDFE